MTLSPSNEKSPEEILWGGPDGKGLVYVVDELARATARNSKVLFGENGSPGVVDTVRFHEKVVNRGERILIWLLALVGTEAASLVGYLLWLALQAKAPGG